MKEYLTQNKLVMCKILKVFEDYPVTLSPYTLRLAGLSKTVIDGWFHEDALWPQFRLPFVCDACGRSGRLTDLVGEERVEIEAHACHLGPVMFRIPTAVAGPFGICAAIWMNNIPTAVLQTLQHYKSQCAFDVWVCVMSQGKIVGRTMMFKAWSGLTKKGRQRVPNF